MSPRLGFADLVARLGALGCAGPWTEVADVPPGGPWAFATSPDACALAYTPARLRDELAGATCAAGHPAIPRVLAHDDTVLVYEPVGDPIDDPASALASWPAERFAAEATVREHLAAIASGTHIGRALQRAGVARAQIDRFLAARIAVETRRGPSAGPIEPFWYRRARDGRPLVLRWSLGRSDGWLSHALAEIERATGNELATFHREASADADAADRAYALAQIERLASAVAHGNDPAVDRSLRDAVERFLPVREPPRVRVTIAGPPWLDATPWLPAGDEVPPAQARRIVRVLDDVTLAGEPVRVRVDPPIRAERGPPFFEPPEARRRRIFSRWSEGIRTDDEGLYSATPEALALWLTRDAEGVVIDGTAGIGSIAIALARQSRVREVIAVDVDAPRLAMARHNARIYGVEGRIRFVHDDVGNVLRKTRADLLVLDPPWGGRDYDRERIALGDLGMDVASLLGLAPPWVKLKLPPSIDATTLPPGFRLEAAVDSRGIVKFLAATRGAPPGPPSPTGPPDTPG